MNTPIRNAAWALAALALAGLSLAPAAQAITIVPVTGGANLCPTYDPAAWVNYCVTLAPVSTTVHAYTVDTTPDYTTVCPLPGTCVNVPVILTLVDPWDYNVNYYRATYSVSPNAGQVYEDVCDVIGIYCAVLQNLLQALAPSTASSSPAMPHGLEFQGLGDVGSDGTLDVAFFQAPGGQTVVLPLV